MKADNQGRNGFRPARVRLVSLDEADSALPESSHVDSWKGPVNRITEAVTGESHKISLALALIALMCLAVLSRSWF